YFVPVVHGSGRSRFPSFLSWSRAHRHLPSFPTRRSSDLLRLRLHALLAVEDGDGAVEHAQGALDLDREVDVAGRVDDVDLVVLPDRKSTRLNSSHVKISYAVFCLKKKNQH